MQEYDRNSVEGSSERVETPMFLQPDEKIKMISEGYILRNKFNSGTYEKIFLKLKKSVLYIYVSEKAERSQNTIQIEDIEEIKIHKPEKPHFTINFKGLHKTKELKKLELENEELKRDDVGEILIDLYKKNELNKMKAIDYSSNNQIEKKEEEIN